MRAIGIPTLLICSLLLPLVARAEPGRTVPRDPGFFTRLVGGGHPAYVTRAVQQARKAPPAQRRRILNNAFKAGVRRGDLSVYSAIKLAKKMPGDSARNVLLRTFAHVNRGVLSAGQIAELGRATTRRSTHRRLLLSFRARNASRLTARGRDILDYELDLLKPKPKPKTTTSTSGGDWADPLGVNPVKLEQDRRAATKRFVNGTSGGVMDTLRDGHTMAGNHEKAARLDQARAALNGDWDAMIQAGLRAQAIKNNAKYNPFK